MKKLIRYLMRPRAYYHGAWPCTHVYIGPRIACWFLRALDNSIYVTLPLLLLGLGVVWLLTHIRF